MTFHLGTYSPLSEKESRGSLGWSGIGNASLGNRNVAQWRTLWGITGFLWGREVGGGGSGEEEHVLVLIFSFCVIPSSKHINHKRVISWSDRCPCPCQLSSALQRLPHCSPAALQENILERCDFCQCQTDGHVRVCERVRVWVGELERKKSKRRRAKQLFALISLLRHIQAPQGEHSSLKVTFALYWEERGGYSLHLCWLQKCVCFFWDFLTVSLWRDWVE